MAPQPVLPKSLPVYKQAWFLAAALVLVTAGIYSPVLHHPFVNFDDQAYIVENTHVTGGLTLAMVRWALTSLEEANWHPVTWLSHALDCELFGLNPAGHHATNVMVHAANAAILFLLLLGATGARWRSLAVGALFALHPLNVESVAWTAERKNVLSMLCLLLALLAYGWYARKPATFRYFVVALLFALGLAAKPMIVTLPFALLLLDYWPLRRVQLAKSVEHPSIQQRSWTWLVLEKVPLLALSAASSVVTIYAQRLSMPTIEALPFAQRIGNAVDSYVGYLSKTFWPAHLAVFYPHEGAHLPAWRIALCIVFLAAVTMWAWTMRHSRSYLLIGWLWFLGNLVPVIGLVQVGDQAMADRYVYLPLIGIFVMVVWGIAGLVADYPQGRNVAGLMIGGAVLVLVALSVVTVRQIATWSSSFELWSHALEVTSDNYLAEDYIGSALLVQAYETTGQRFSDEATAHFRNAVRINPHDAIGHLNLGADFHEHGRLQEAIEQYSAVLRYTRDEHLMAKAYIALGAAYGRLHEFDKAEQSYRMATRLEPDNRGLFMRIGQLGMEEQIAQLTEATATHPTAENYVALG
jgi:hypothetical protein